MREEESAENETGERKEGRYSMDQLRYRPPILIQRKLLRCILPCAEIREYVGTAETVDRLFWITDEKDGAIRPMINLAENVVLNGVCILKFINQCYSIVRTKFRDQ